MNNLMKRNGTLPAAFPLFDDFLGRDLFNRGLSNFSAADSTLPAVNIREDKDQFCVEVAAPGMKKEDFKVQLHNNLLTISSEHRSEHEENNEGRYSTREFSYRAFQRSFTLPKDVVDDQQIVAKYEEGLLRLTIPKKEEAKEKAPRTIEIA